MGSSSRVVFMAGILRKPAAQGKPRRGLPLGVEFSLHVQMLAVPVANIPRNSQDCKNSCSMEIGASLALRSSGFVYS
jgi:hypothetical protein